MITPKAPCKFACLERPDTYKDKVIGYKISLVFEANDPFLEKLESDVRDLYDEYEGTLTGKALKAAQAMTYKEPVEDDYRRDENKELVETGKKLVRFKSVKYQPKMYDVTGREIDVEDIPYGTIVRVSYKIGAPYAALGFRGCPLYLQKIQVISLPDTGDEFDDESGGEWDERGGSDDAF